MRERLQKYLARAGIASRRACEELIERGRVRVNGKFVRELGTTVEPGVDVVEFDGRRIVIDDRRVYLLLNKPPNVISAAADPEGRPVVTSLIPAEYGRLYPVGRLDWDSEGAILMTNDGELTELLTHPRHEVEKSYMVKTSHLVDDDDPRIERIRNGVKLDDGYVTQPALVVRDGDTGKHTWFIVSIREGKNRQIRRMFDAVGLDVRRLRRVAYGPVLLGTLEQGEFRRLTEEEIDELYAAAGKERPELSAARGRLPVGKREGAIEANRAATAATGPRTRGFGDEPGARPEPSRGPTADDRGQTARGPSRGAAGGRGGAPRPTAERSQGGGRPSGGGWGRPSDGGARSGDDAGRGPAGGQPARRPPANGRSGGGTDRGGASRGAGGWGSSSSGGASGAQRDGGGWGTGRDTGRDGSAAPRGGGAWGGDTGPGGSRGGSGGSRGGTGGGGPRGGSGGSGPRGAGGGRGGAGGGPRGGSGSGSGGGRGR